MVADCTGHGVPGAMLSVLCIGILNETIKSPTVHNPAEVLNYTRSRLSETFKANERYTINDGMDLSICVVDRAVSTIDFAGANRPLFLVRNKKIMTIKGNKQSVGNNHQMKDFTFERIKFEKGDHMYLFSDGVVDQFGGPRNKKFMTSRLKESLIEVSDLSVHKQREAIKSNLEKWQGEEEQTDDICIMGVQL